jgi:hypothetical protein
MKKLIFILILTALNYLTQAQFIGIGNTTPVSILHATSTTRDVLTIENSNALNNNIQTGINFSAGINSANSYKYTGAIRTIGISNEMARLGIFTFASNTPAGLIERLTIMDNGNVGINETNPLYRLTVSGSGYFSAYVGIQTAPSPSYSLSVVGPSRYYNDLRVDGILNPNNTLNIGSNTAIGGTLTAQNGKGMVQSTSSTQMKIKRASVNFNASGFGAGSTIESGYLYFNEDFTAVTVVVGQAYAGTGDYAKVLIVPFEVDEINDRCRFKITNVSSASITFDASWEIVEIGN